MKLPYLHIVRGRDGVRRAYVRRGDKHLRVESSIDAPDFMEKYEAAKFGEALGTIRVR